LGRHRRSTSSRTGAHQNELRIHAAAGCAVEKIRETGSRFGATNRRCFCRTGRNRFAFSTCYGGLNCNRSTNGSCSAYCRAGRERVAFSDSDYCDCHRCADGVGVGNSAATHAGSIGGNSSIGDDADCNSGGDRNFTCDVVTDNFADSFAYAGTSPATNYSSATRYAFSGIGICRLSNGFAGIISESVVNSVIRAAAAIERKTRGARRTNCRAASDPHAFTVG
jgi:hypothetical protein